MKLKIIIIAISVIVFLIGSIPYFIAYQNEDEQHVFNGYLHYPEDMDSYAAWTKQSSEGNWLFYNPYDSSKNDGEFLSILWLFSGKLSVGFSVILCLLRVLSLSLLALGLWLVLKELKLKTFVITWVYVVFFLGGGLGWLMHFMRLDAPPPDLYTEIFPFVQISFVPHSAFAHAFVLFAVLSAYLTIRKSSFRQSILTGVLLLILGSFRSYELAVAYVAIVTFFVFHAFSVKDKINHLKLVLPIISIPLPIFAYAWWLTNKSLGFSIWGTSNAYPPPEILTFVIGIFPIVLCGLIWIFARSWKLHRYTLFDTLFASWIATTWILMYSGLLPWAWRTCGTFITPMLLAGAYAVNSLTWRNYIKIPILFLVLVIALPTTFLIVNEKTEIGQTQNRYYYHHPKLDETFSWIEANNIKGIFFTHGHIGQKIPGKTMAKSIMGHKDLTENFIEKRRDYAYFVGARNAGRAVEILWKNNTEWLLWGPLERRRATFDPDDLQGFRKFYDNGLYKVYGNLKDQD